MSRTNFEKLEVYLLSERLADAVWDIMVGWDYFAKDTVGKQLVRSADAIGANIAEGTGRYSFRENRRFVRFARGSLHEVKHWLRRAYRLEPLSEEQVGQLKPIMDELSPASMPTTTLSAE